MEKKSYLKNFNLIIGRYNELGLKSRKVRGRMERILLNHIQRICKREGLNLESSYRRSGRIVFHFPNEQIPKATKIFRHIIGLVSFSPSFTIENDYETITNSVLKFATQYIKDGDSFAVRSRRIKPYHLTSTEIDKDIGSKIFELFEAKGESLSVDLSNPQKPIFIDVREKEAYIYSEIIPTIWGGNPIETDKAVLALWHGIPGENVATQLLLRRGAVVAPVLISTYNFEGKNKDKNISAIIKQIENVAKFLAEPIKLTILNAKPLIEQINQDISSQTDLKNYIIYSKLILLATLLKEVNHTGEFLYTNKRLYFKGVVTPTSLTDNLYYFAGHQFPAIHFMPLIGLSQKIIQDLSQRLENGVDDNQYSEFSIGHTIVSNTSCKTLNDLHSEINNKDFAKIILDITIYFEKNNIRSLVDQIVKNREVQEISGKIL